MGETRAEGHDGYEAPSGELTKETNRLSSPSFARTTLLWLLGSGAVLAILLPSGSDAYSAGTWDAFLFDAFPGLTASQVNALVFAVRKTIHFLTYGILAWIWAAAITGAAHRRVPATHSSRLPKRRKHRPIGRSLTLWGGLIALFVAAADEWNQTRLPERSGSITDVLLDLAGIVTFLGIRYWIHTRHGERHDDQGPTPPRE